MLSEGLQYLCNLTNISTRKRNKIAGTYNTQGERKNMLKILTETFFDGGKL